MMYTSSGIDFALRKNFPLNPTDFLQITHKP